MCEGRELVLKEWGLATKVFPSCRQVMGERLSVSQGARVFRRRTTIPVGRTMTRQLCHSLFFVVWSIYVGCGEEMIQGKCKG